MPTDQILATEEMVGAGHATKSDTLNRFLNKITTAGDILYGTASATAARLGIGTAGQVLKVNSGATAPEWASANDAKAWVNFKGTGTVAIRASYNVSSITDNGEGLWTVNFTNNMPDVNYCANVSGTQIAAGSSNTGVGFQSSSFAVGSIGVFAQASSGTDVDLADVCVAIFR